jgi:hypothetical protein
MKATLAVITTCLLLSFSALAQQEDHSSHATMDHANCPMMANMAQSSRHSHADMNARGDKAMGFSQEKTTHHFRMLADGGAIEVTANDAKDSATLAQVRAHLEHIAHAFAQGDFAIPNQVHAEMPSGTGAMKELASQLSYKYEPLENGARVRIITQDAKALAAVHDFIGYQIREHQTGDSLEVPK